MFRKALATVSLVLLTGCGSRSTTPVESLDGTDDLTRFALTSLSGTRDGERIDVQAVYGDGSRSLRVHLQFKVTPQARLESGAWTGLAGEGSVRERSVTFLGGQAGTPSIGGSFDLVGSDHRPQYRITIPLQPLKHALEPAHPGAP
jgi:hypothetical protein